MVHILGGIIVRQNKRRIDVKTIMRNDFKIIVFKQFTIYIKYKDTT